MVICRLSTPRPFPGRIDSMTFRVYVRWPSQRVSNKTKTESRAAAQVAFEELVGRSDLDTAGALGIAFSEDGRQIEYHRFRDDPPPSKSAVRKGARKA